MDPHSISAFSTFTILIILLSLSFFFSLSEVAFMSASKERIYKLKLDGLKDALLAYELLEKKEKIVSSCSLADHIINISASSIMTIFLMRFEIINSNHILLFSSSIIMSIFIFIFTESIPKILAIRKADNIVLQFSGLINILTKLIYPLFFFINKTNEAILNVLKIEKETNDSLEANQSILGTVEMYHKKGAIIDEYRDMLSSILSLDKYDISHVMTHKSDTYSLSVNDSCDEMFEKIINSKYSKIPVFDNKYEEVLGILKVVDFLRGVQKGTIKKDEIINKYDLKSVMIKPYFIPEGASLKSQLPKFKDNGSNMGIVIDEYGSVIGFVTIEDILEHIVGDIKDSNDSETMIIKVSDQIFILDGDLPLIELNEEANLNFTDTQFSTVSGLITNHIERIPAQGEEFEISGSLFKVIEINKNRIEKVKLTKLQSKNELQSN